MCTGRPFLLTGQGDAPVQNSDFRRLSPNEQDRLRDCQSLKTALDPRAAGQNNK